MANTDNPRPNIFVYIAVSILLLTRCIEVHSCFLLDGRASQTQRYRCLPFITLVNSDLEFQIRSRKRTRRGLFIQLNENGNHDEQRNEDNGVGTTKADLQQQLLPVVPLPEQPLGLQQDDLLQQLDNEFQYNGRLLRGNAKQNRCGYVCIIGAPNMGKSTLLNAVLQEDLCICTSRPQTTRHAILGLLSTNHTQICFIDTPGIIDNPAYKLQEGMMEAVSSSLRDADVLLIVTDIFSTPIPNDRIFQKVVASTKPIIVVINKIDLSASATAATVEEVVAKWRHILPNAFMIIPASSINGPNDAGIVLLRRLLCGGPEIRTAIRNIGRPIPGMLPNYVSINDPLYHDDIIRSYLLPLSPPLYDTDILTDRSERFVVSEIIRSVLFDSYQKELPYCCEVRISEFKEPKLLRSPSHIGGHTKKNNAVRISADIIVERDSQKVIVIGRNGQQIKQVGILAREKVQDFLQQPVELYLNVKVNKDWRKKEDQLRLYGYLS